ALGREVHPCAEGLAGAGDDDGADAVVVVDLLEGGLELVGHLHGEGVHLLRTVERDEEDALVHGQGEGLLVGPHALASIWVTCEGRRSDDLLRLLDVRGDYGIAGDRLPDRPGAAPFAQRGMSTV